MLYQLSYSRLTRDARLARAKNIANQGIAHNRRTRDAPGVSPGI
jgi:hypothetical protein